MEKTPEETKRDRHLQNMAQLWREVMVAQCRCPTPRQGGEINYADTVVAAYDLKFGHQK